MKKKKQIEERIKMLEGSIAKHEHDANSQYASDHDRLYWLNVIIPSVKVRIDELKWILGIF